MSSLMRVPLRASPRGRRRRMVVFDTFRVKSLGAARTCLAQRVFRFLVGTDMHDRSHSDQIGDPPLVAADAAGLCGARLGAFEVQVQVVLPREADAAMDLHRAVRTDDCRV